MEETSQAVPASSQAAPKDTRPLFEIGFHVVPTIEEAKVAEVVDALRAEIAKAGGEVAREQFPAKMTLAYVIDRADSGKHEKFAESYFGWIQFTAEERSGLPALEAYLRNHKHILRSLLIRTTYDNTPAARHAVFASNRLEGETIRKPEAKSEEAGEVSEADLDKSLEALGALDEKEGIN